MFDRGFLYGDSVYETLRVYGGVPFAFDAHLERLYGSGRRVSFELPFSGETIRAAAKDTIAASELSDAYMRIIVTRGAGPMGLDPALAVDPVLLVLVLPLPPLPAEMYSRGRTAALVSVTRNFKMAIDPQAKTGNYMNNVLAAGDARRRSADEAIMLDHQGHVAEGSSANVFAWRGGAWHTPPLEVGILGGITRRTVLDVCARHGIPAVETVMWPDELRAADEVFLCSSVRELLPIVELDGQPVGTGRPGPQTTRLLGLYRDEVRARSAGGWGGR